MKTTSSPTITLALSTTLVTSNTTSYLAVTLAVLFLAAGLCLQFTRATFSNVPLVVTLTSIETTNEALLVKLPTFHTTTLPTQV